MKDDVKCDPKSEDSFKDQENPKGGKKSGKKKRNGRGGFKKDFDKDKKGVGHNDVRSYMRLPYLSANSARLWFSNIVGTQANFGNTGYFRDVDANYSISYNQTPGIMEFEIAYGPGVLDSNQASYASPLQMFCQAFYSATRKPNSGARNYEAVDLTMYLLCLASVHVELHRAVTAYGLFNTYNVKNRYYGNNLLHVMGYDWDDISQNPARFRAVINKYSYLISQLALPGIVPVFTEWFNLFANVYMDRPTLDAQLYVFKPTHHYQYTLEGTSPNQVGNAVAINTESLGLLSANSLDFLLNSMVTPLLSRDDIGLMSGDLLKAFDGTLLAPPLVDEGLMAVPVFNEEINLKIENADVIGGPEGSSAQGMANIDTFSVRQNGGLLEYKPKVTRPATSTAAADTNMSAFAILPKARKVKFFNMRDDVVSDEMVMIASRWKVNLSSQHTSSLRENEEVTIKDAGTEFIYNVKVWINRSNGAITPIYYGGDTLVIYETSYNPSGFRVPSLPAYTMESYLSAWQYAPFFIRVAYPSTFSVSNSYIQVNVTFDDMYVIEGIIGDLDNFHISTDQEIHNLHQTAIASVWFIEGISGVLMQG